jgi:hypothetical protein
LLDKGLTFIPTYTFLPVNDIYSFQNRLIRNLKLKDYYQEEDEDDSVPFDYTKKSFTKPSRWIPPDHSISQSTLDSVQEILSATDMLIKHHKVINGRLMLNNRSVDNLTLGERRALQELRNKTDIIIKPADKGSATVVMNKDAYLQEAYRQLNNENYYRRLDSPIYLDNVPKINAILDEMLDAGIISTKQLVFLRADSADRPRVFYLLPKIHKPRCKWPQPDVMPEGRPIVSDCGSESYRVSQYIDSFVRPISIQHPSYIKDTYDFVSKIRNQRIPKNALLVTGDVSSLYTNMNIDRILSATQAALRKHPSPGRPDAHLLRLLDITLRNNDFEFDDRFFLQTCGTAMGKTYAPGLADIYMEEFDEGAIAGFNNIMPLLYYRFLDDIFFVWIGSREELHQFELHLNSLIPGITITLCCSDVSVDFLDTTVYRQLENDDDVLQTRVFFKPTDTHQLLDKTSFHPRHTAKGVLKSQILRFKRISSSRDDFDAACRVLFNSLAKRNYSKSMMRKMKRDIWYSINNNAINHTLTNPKLLPVIIPYNSLGCKLASSWRSIISNNEVFHKYRMITAYCAGQSLRRKLVHSRQRLADTAHQVRADTTDQPQRCSKCSSMRCKACNYINSGSTFSSSYNKRTFSVSGNIKCTSSNIVYLVTCRKCSLQYVGETSRLLRDRINDHLSRIRLRKPTPVGLHFTSEGHRITDFSVMGIEQLSDATEPEVRRMKETTWQNKLQTAYPLGINNLKLHYLS